MNNNIKQKYLNTKGSVKEKALSVQDYIFKYKELFDVDVAFRENIAHITDKLTLKFRPDWFKWEKPWYTDQYKWKELYEDIFSCKNCELDYLRKNRGKNKVSGVFFEEVLSKPIMVIQEQPDPVTESSAWNKYNMQFGCPLSFGQSASLFEDMINYIGLTKNQLYLTTLVKCGFKTKDYDNQEIGEFIRTCRPFFEKQLKLFKPVVIWTIGVAVFEYILRYLEDNYMNVEKEVLWSFDNKTKYIYHTENIILVNSSNPYYIMQKEKEYWFLKKEMAMLDLLKILVANFEKKGII